MLKSLVQNQWKLAREDSISSSSEPRQRRGSFRDHFVKFKILRSITKAPPPEPKKLDKKISKIIEKNPKCQQYYLKFQSCQKYIYLLVEDSTSSMLANIFYFVIVFSVLFTTIDSIVTSSIGTNNVLEGLELAVSLIFVLEYTLRVVSASAFGDSTLKIMLRPFMIIDLLALTPFFLELGFQTLIYDPEDNTKLLRILRWSKALRVFKLGRYLRDTHVFSEGMRASLGSFGFLTLLIAVVNIVGATAIYYSEREWLGLDFVHHPEQRIRTMADAMWFVLVTLATVGYGDYTPESILGKAIASVLAVIGMLIFSLPIAILGNNFQNTYAQQTETDKIQAYKTMKFEGDQKNLTDSQKEVRFMNERIRSIEATNKTIITMLTNSEVLYKQVAKDLKNLYESIYADEDTLAKKAKKEEVVEHKGSPFLSSKIDTRIKLYEKLNRAKRKINLANIFQKPTTSQVTGGDETAVNLSNDIIEDAAQEEKTGMLNRNRPKKTVPPKDLKSKMTKVLSSKIDLDASDIIETDLGPPPNDVPSMAQWIKSKKKDIGPTKLDESADISSQDISELPPCPKKKKTRAFMKSHSVNNPNQFLTYYVQNLNFIPLELIGELMGSGSTSSDSDSDSDSTESDIKKNAPRTRRASVSGETKVKFKLHASPEQGRKQQRRKTRIIDTTKKGKIVPKNYDKKLWELSGKILERMDAKMKLENSLSALEKTVERNHDAGEIDRQIAAAQEEIKRLLNLKKERTQMLTFSGPALDMGGALFKTQQHHMNDSSMEINISIDEKNPKIEAFRHARAHMHDFHIPIIKEEDEIQHPTGNATPITMREHPRVAQKSPDNQRQSRWKITGNSLFS